MPSRSLPNGRAFVDDGPVSRILSPACAGGRSFIWDPPCGGPQATYPEVGRAEPARSRRTGILPYLVLLRVGFALPSPSLPRRCALTAPFHPYPCQLAPAGRYVFCGAVRASRFDRDSPDVIRHTALWSSDFPPRQAGATVQSNTCVI